MSEIMDALYFDHNERFQETVNKQELTSLLDGALHRLKLIASKYTSKAALGNTKELCVHAPK